MLAESAVGAIDGGGVDAGGLVGELGLVRFQGRPPACGVAAYRRGEAARRGAGWGGREQNQDWRMRFRGRPGFESERIVF